MVQRTLEERERSKSDVWFDYAYMRIKDMATCETRDTAINDPYICLGTWTDPETSTLYILFTKRYKRELR